MGSTGGLDSGNALVENMSENIPAAGVAGTCWAIVSGTRSVSPPDGFVSPASILLGFQRQKQGDAFLAKNCGLSFSFFGFRQIGQCGDRRVYWWLPIAV